MTCFIIDDEPLAVRLLESFVSRTPDLELRGSYTDSIEALTALQQSPVTAVSYEKSVGYVIGSVVAAPFLPVQLRLQ